MTEEQGDLIEKAKRSLQSARLLLANGSPDFAASRAYYTMFYLASALLIGKGLKFSKHGSLIEAFGMHFAKTGEIDAKFHRYLIDAQDDRLIGDYTAKSILTEAEVATMVSQAEEFIALAEQMLGTTPSESE